MKKSLKKMIATALTTALFATAMVSNAFAFSLFGGSSTAKEAEADPGYVFTYNGADIAMGAPSADIVAALGAPAAKVEMDSCAYQGKDIVYIYDKFEIGTYPCNGADCVSYLTILDASLSTPEGIHFGSSVDDVTKAYGTDYTEEFGVYHYVKGNSELAVFTTNKVVDGIEYTVITQ